MEALPPDPQPLDAAAMSIGAGDPASRFDLKTCAGVGLL
jgi:hypothetical protein